MGAAPLKWLAKIGGDTLKTKAKLLSSAINELYDDGQCKIVAVVDNTADNGKTVLITTDDNKTYSGTIANKKCEFLLPPKTLYTVQKVSSGSAEFTTKVEAGYGDCILVHLDTGYVEVKQGDIVGLDYIKAATVDDLKNKVPEANAVKELNGKLIDQSVGNSIILNNIIGIIGYAFNNKLVVAYVPLPFVTKNTNYEIKLNRVEFDSFGNVLSKCNVYVKTNCGFSFTCTPDNATYGMSKMITNLSFTITFR